MVQRPKGRIDMGCLPGLPGFRSRIVRDTGPEQETNSAHILRLFWGAVLAVARRAKRSGGRPIPTNSLTE